MQRGSESLPGVSHSAAPDGRAAIEFLTGADQPAYRHNGVEVRPGELVVNDLRLAHRRWSTPHRWGAMSLSPTGLAQVGYALVGRDLTVPPVARVVRPAPELMKSLLTLHAGIAQLAKAAPGVLAHAEVARSLEQALIRAMIESLCCGTFVEPRFAVRQHTAIMARLEDFLAAHHDRPVYLAEICAATGASERTLRNC